MTPDQALTKLSNLAQHRVNGLLTERDYRREAAIALLSLCEYVRDVTLDDVLDDVQDALNKLREDGS